MKTSAIPRPSWLWNAVLAVSLAAAGCGASGEHLSFATPEEAGSALAAAAQADDSAKVEAIFGPGGETIVSTGDPVADRNARAEFARRYAEKHAFVPADGGRQTLTVGNDDWPLPVPLVQKGGKWMFDGDGAVVEVALRRIGRNELGAIAVCRGYVRAQLEYAASGHDGAPAGIFAQKLVSDPGSQNGLYWPTEEGETPSPVGPFVAHAASEGYRRGAGADSPYHGYHFRPLFAQGANAEGGDRDYFVNGNLVEGFALVAWPAEYGITGLETFVVDKSGVVRQKDLGEDTDKEVAKMDRYDPDPSWSIVELDTTEAAGEAEGE